MPIKKSPAEKPGEKDLPRQITGTILISFCWLAAILLSLYWDIHNQNIVTEESARIEARTAFFKMKIFRDWMIQKEKVYAKVSQSTPPGDLERKTCTPSSRVAHDTSMRPSPSTSPTSANITSWSVPPMT